MLNLSKDFFNNISLGKKKIRGRFVIPSGVRCARASAIERYFGIASVGIITTKSISFEPKRGYKEPLYASFGDNSYINAVGLENPGALAFCDELSKISVPDDKFLLVSIFGSDEESFFQAAQALARFADGFELNMSCPHAKGYGLQVGSDADLVTRITRRIAEGFDIPVFVKLSAAVPDVAATAAAAVKCGAKGITITNTIGPAVEYVSGTPVLSNVYGGMSGEAIRPMGLKATRDIRNAVGGDPIIIGMGGIFNKEHVRSYHTAGADFFGIGSALTNLNTREAVGFFDDLERGLIQGIATPPPVGSANMRYGECVVESNIKLTEALHKIKLGEWEGYDRDADVAGRFFFIMIPSIGEKPFSVFSYSNREFIVKNVGCFTKALTGLNVGDTVFVRGPYGNGMPCLEGSTVNLVAGGTGIAPVYEIARKYQKSNKIRFFLGGRTSRDIFDLERYMELGEVVTAVEDGGTAPVLVTDILGAFDFGEGRQVFVNVGPRAMIEKCYEIERGVTGDDGIWASIEYHTSCGVGICGKCATDNGALSCVDGPFLRVGDA